MLKNFNNYDKMETFDGRLKLQKTIYLMQAFDLYLGYNFTWYIRGPYCTELTKDGYALIPVCDSVSIGQFKDPDAQRRFSIFKKFIEGHENDPDWLEIVASIHFLRHVYPNIPKEKVLQIVKDKQDYFTIDKCREAWQYLEKWGKI